METRIDSGYVKRLEVILAKIHGQAWQPYGLVEIIGKDEAIAAILSLNREYIGDVELACYPSDPHGYIVAGRNGLRISLRNTMGGGE